MDELYLDHVLDHAENPRCCGSLDHPTHTGSYSNPTCGDQLTLDLNVDANGHLAAVRWRGEGCAISQAAASLSAEMITNLPVADFLAWDEELVLQKLGLPAISYSRRNCALVFWRALRQLLTEAA